MQSAWPSCPVNKALSKVMLDLLKDDTEVYKQFVQNESFKRVVTDLVYGLRGLTCHGHGQSQKRPTGVDDAIAGAAGSARARTSSAHG
ncbi:MAG: hypothetical protein IV100_32615 [Myxococcales bacterium]|nr:hypothetical protein [Myxococcales bacterium]